MKLHKKLNLSKETVRQLSDSESSDFGGGTIIVYRTIVGCLANTVLCQSVLYCPISNYNKECFSTRCY